MNLTSSHHLLQTSLALREGGGAKEGGVFVPKKSKWKPTEAENEETLEICCIAVLQIPVFLLYLWNVMNITIW